MTDSNLAHRRSRTHWLCISVPQRKSRPQTRSGGRVLRSPSIQIDNDFVELDFSLTRALSSPAGYWVSKMKCQQTASDKFHHGVQPMAVTRRGDPQTQTSQLGRTVDEAIVVQVQDILSVDADEPRLTSMKTPESTWELSCVRASSLQLR